jgi:hypothetical protein
MAKQKPIAVPTRARLRSIPKKLIFTKKLLQTFGHALESTERMAKCMASQKLRRLTSKKPRPDESGSGRFKRAALHRP